MSAFEPVEVPAASELVTERLRRAIHLGTYAPGEQLPTAREPAAALGVSRVTLREALRTLAERGYIVTRRGPRGGSTVLASAQDTTALRRALADRIEEFDAIFAYREIVECGAAGLAARARRPEHVAQLRETIAVLDASESVAAFRRADGAFHSGVAAAAGNPLLTAAIEDARQMVFTPTDALPYSILLAVSREGHEAICDAIEAQDADAATAAMSAHIRASAREFRGILGLPPLR